MWRQDLAKAQSGRVLICFRDQSIYGFLVPDEATLKGSHGANLTCDTRWSTG